MHQDTIEHLGQQAEAKIAAQRASLASHLVRSMLAGMYVGASVVLILIVGATLPREVQKVVMGACFGGALTLVLFAGSELFTGSNLVLSLGVWTGRVRAADLLANWFWTWVGNLLGSVLLALLVVRSGVLDAEPIATFVLTVVEKKIHLAPEPLFLRAVLANWLVCLAVWMAARAKSDSARILLIWWCMFTFVTCSYEHSVANMSGLTMGLLLPHGAGIGLRGCAYNLALATAGNVVGGAGLVAGLYWLGSNRPRRAVLQAPTPIVACEGSASEAE